MRAACHRVSRTSFIIPHLGSFADDWRAQLALIDHLVRHPNIYTDTSGVRRFDLLEQAVRRAGAAKVLFGSDGPWLHPGVELAKVRALGLAAQHGAAGRSAATSCADRPIGEPARAPYCRSRTTVRQLVAGARRGAAGSVAVVTRPGAVGGALEVAVCSWRQRRARMAASSAASADCFIGTPARRRAGWRCRTRRRASPAGCALRAGPFVGRMSARRHRPPCRRADQHARHQLPQVAHVARILAAERDGRAPRASISGGSSPPSAGAGSATRAAEMSSRRSRSGGRSAASSPRSGSRSRAGTATATSPSRSRLVAHTSRKRVCCQALLPDALVRVLLHDAQQLRLQRRRQLADLVEEQRAAVGQRERAVARATAPVNAPRSWPKNSLPDSSGTTVVQSRTTRSRLCGRHRARG